MMTEDEKRLCIMTELDDNVFVEAGAGAGKTSLIVNRIVNQLRAGMSPESIVVITFTNAAAEELRCRITAEVRKASKEEPKLVEAVKNLDQMNISTIHSFSYRLLQERLFDAKLPMDVMLIENDETKQQHTTFFSEWMKHLQKEDWDKLCEDGTSRYTATGKMRSLFESICELPDDTVIQNGTIIDLKVYEAEAKNLADDFLSDLCTYITTLTDGNYNLKALPDKRFLRKQGQTIVDLYTQAEPSYIEILGQICTEFTNKTTQYITITAKELCKGMSKGDVELFDRYLQEWDEQLSRVQDITRLLALREKAKSNKYCVWLTYAMAAREEYRKKRPVNTLGSDELLQKTQRMICDSKEAREYFAKKIRCIYVDEFQDTDHIQEEFIWKLAAEPEDESKLRDGALFVVGDPKQSIYRFRGAEPEVYFSTQKKMGALPNAKVYCLKYNFRSNGKLIEWINAEFDKRGDICPSGYSGMTAKRALPTAPSNMLLAGVYYYRTPNKNSFDIKIHDDAEALCNLIVKSVKNKYQICDYDKDANPYERDIRFSDYLVLCYSKTDMKLYLEYLNQYRIPVQINGESKVEENLAINAFVRLFDYLTHPYDRLKKAGATEYLMNNGFEADAVLRRLSDEVQGMSAAGIAGYLLKHFHLLLPLDTTISSVQLLSAQTKVQQMTEAVLENPALGKEEMAALFRKYRNEVVEKELALQENEDAVRFMNLHKAKGLEGNIVVLAKRTENKQPKDGVYSKDKTYYPAIFGDFGKTLWTSYQDNPAVVSDARQDARAEMIRLEYVAATRAKQALVVLDAINDNAMFHDYEFQGYANLVGSLESMIHAGGPVSIPTELAIDTELVWEEKFELQEAVYHSYKPSDFEKKAGQTKTAGSAEEDASGENAEAEEPTERIASRRPKGAVFGTAMHRALELLIARVLRPVATVTEENKERMVLSCAKQAVLEGRAEIPAEETAVYEEYLLKIMQCFSAWEEKTQILKHAQEVYTELPFSFFDREMLIDEEKKAVWMNGTADLIVLDTEGNYTVLDYKSDRGLNYTEEEFEEVLKKKYSGQLRMYRQAVSRLFDVADAEKVKLKILSFRGEEEITLRCTELE